VHPKVVSERLGHANIGITLDTYSHAIPAMQEDAAARVAALLAEYAHYVGQGRPALVPVCTYSGLVPPS